MNYSGESRVQKFPKIIRKSTIQERFPISTSALYERTKRGLFPTSIQLGGKAVGWIEEEVDTVIRAMITGADKSSLEQLVARLISERNERFRI